MFYDNGLKFSCNRCSDCCRLEPGVVYLSLEDLEKLCNQFQISTGRFIETYCRWMSYYDGSQVLCLKERKNFDCILWNKDCGCTAYGSRPVQCSTYPFWSWMLESKESWDACSKDCPGINAKDGQLWTKEQIEEQKKAYEAIKPLHREDYMKIVSDSKNSQGDK